MIKIGGHRIRAVMFGDKEILAVRKGNDTIIDLLRFIIVADRFILLSNDYLQEDDEITSNTTWQIY